ncbi:hypothetical protein KDX40_03660 [Burkholderia ambifaria]|nr:hypothetical protein [Burkholderia ambifaria]
MTPIKSIAILFIASLSISISRAENTTPKGDAKTSNPSSPREKSAPYTVHFFNSNNGSVTVTRTSYTCMYNAGDSQFTMQSYQPKMEILEDKNSGLDCWNSWKAVVWNVSGAVSGNQVTFYHAYESGMLSHWETKITDSSGVVKSALCYTEDSENGSNCLNKSVEDVVAIDITL